MKCGWRKGKWNCNCVDSETRRIYGEIHRDAMVSDAMQSSERQPSEAVNKNEMKSFGSAPLIRKFRKVSPPREIL